MARMCESRSPARLNRIDSISLKVMSTDSSLSRRCQPIWTRAMSVEPPPMSTTSSRSSCEPDVLPSELAARARLACPNWKMVSQRTYAATATGSLQIISTWNAARSGSGRSISSSTSSFTSRANRALSDSLQVNG